MKYLLKPINTKSNLYFFKTPKNNTYLAINPKLGIIGDFSFVKRNELYIERLFIKKEHQRKGYGVKILNFIRKLSEQEGLNGKMRVWAALLENSNNPPHIFYRKYGFTSSDTKALAEIDEYIKTGKPLPKFYKPIYMHI